MSTSGHNLYIFTITQNPSDYPGKFVVRRWAINSRRPEPSPDPLPWCIRNTLEEARATLPHDLSCFKRHPSDDPVILESWF